MITPQDIYKATDGGLRIILDLYPQAESCIDNKNKKFAIRNERTPSANIRLADTNKYGRIWQVTDFGDEGRGENAIDLYMKEHGMDRTRFREALLQLAAKYGVTDIIDHNVNKPDIRQRPAKIDEAEGSRSFELNEKFTDDELKILGPRVTQEDVDSLHWHSVKWITNVKDRTVTVKSSNSHYPIFMRECLIEESSGDETQKFFKVYEPLNPDKGFRFSYTPAGKKPRNYINGLAELKEAYRIYNENEEREWNKIHDDGKPYREKKLDMAFICSGERDSLCCRSIGYHPLWFNSETYQLSEHEYQEIMKYVEVLYNIPDIDETGKRKGKELAKKFIDIHTIWLPEKLSQYKDNRGKPRKDLRDFMGVWPDKKEFKHLIELALPLKFWTFYKNKDGRSKYEIDTACLLYFLRTYGFYTMQDENAQTVLFIHIDGNIVRKVTPKEMREFIRKWVEDNNGTREIRNLVYNSMKLSPYSLENLYEKKLDFTSYTFEKQLFFFPNMTVEIHAPSEDDNGIKTYIPGTDDLHNYVWKENLIPHLFRKTDDFFKIKCRVDDKGQRHYDIDILNKKSHFFCFLINSSRIFWRKEMEYRFGTNRKFMEVYREQHLFEIDGEGLTDDEIAEQKLNLINKIFAFGYMLHQFKTPSKAWAPMAMDNKIGENDECNGRSGKSFFFTTLAYLLKTVKLSGRNPKLMDNPHVFDQVTKHSQMLLIDDCDRYLNTELFYDNITGDMTVNPKNNRSFNIKFDDSPKLAFTTNYVPSKFDTSSDARLLYMVFSDYYHEKTEDNDYLESRSIRDDFNKDLYGKAYTEEEWMNDINFWLQCCRFYIEVSKDHVKIQPPMTNIVKRRNKQEMGENFEEWANSYFDREGDNLDRFLVREDVFNEYKIYSNSNRITMQSFNKKLKAFVELCPWVKELNPEKYRNSSGRIQQRVKIGLDKEKTKDMIYLESDKSYIEAQCDDDEPF